MKLKHKTKEGTLYNGKQKVFFCATEKDSNTYFDEIAESVWDAVDCAIFYLEYSEEAGNSKNEDDDEITYEELLDLLKEVQLVVAPVTRELLYTDNDVKNKILPHLKGKKNIIPIVLEDREGIPDDRDIEGVFGEIQYLDKTETRDQSVETQEPYEAKFERVLKETLVGNELAEKVRKAFAAYIFLSYRKKDRKYAQELMRLIHSDPVCENIAIWYDEFLIPGEKYNDAIEDAIENCDEFVFNVTNSFLQKGNYVQEVEYPKALSLEDDKPIIPVEMQETDKNELGKLYDGIEGKLLTFDDKQKVCEKVIDAIKDKKEINVIINDENSGDSKHTFYLGLAYLNGIDVEVDEERGERLLEKAANEGVPEAMEKLAQIYFNVKFDLEKAVEWQKKAVNTYKLELEKESLSSETFDRFKTSVIRLKDMYDCNDDTDGKLFCVDIIEDMGKLYADNALGQPEEYRALFNDMEYLRVSAAVWSGKSERSEKIVKDIENVYKEFFKITKKVCDAITYMDILCVVAERTGMAISSAYNKIESFKGAFGEEISAQDLCNVYIKMCKVFIRRQDVSPLVVIGGVKISIDHNFMQNEFGWWKYAEEAYSICKQHVQDTTNENEGSLWNRLYRESLFILATGIEKVVLINEDSDISQELMNDYIDFSEEVRELYADAYDKNELTMDEKYSYIDFLIKDAQVTYRLKSDTLAADESTYKKAVDMAEKLTEINKTRECQIAYWKSLYLCAGKDVDITEKTVKMARQMDEREDTVQTKKRLADSLQKQYRLTSDLSVLEEEIALLEQLACKNLGETSHHNIQKRLLGEYREAYNNSGINKLEKKIVDYIDKYLSLATKIVDENTSSGRIEDIPDISNYSSEIENVQCRVQCEEKYAEIEKLRNTVEEKKKEKLRAQLPLYEGELQEKSPKAYSVLAQKYKIYEKYLRFLCMVKLRSEFKKELSSEIISFYPYVVAELDDESLGSWEDRKLNRFNCEYDISQVYMDMGEYQEAKTHILPALELSEKLQDRYNKLQGNPSDENENTQKTLVEKIMSKENARKEKGIFYRDYSSKLKCISSRTNKLEDLLEQCNQNL